MIKLEHYDMITEWKPDTLCRAYLSKTDSSTEEIESYVNSVLQNLPVSSDMWKRFRYETIKDAEITSLKKLLDDWSSKKEAQKYYSYRDQLTKLDILYWSSMNLDIEDLISVCEACQKYSVNNQCSLILIQMNLV